MKEVVTLQQDLCGKTQYFGDEYVKSVCQFKMCAAECIPGKYNFRYAGNDYARTTYCCKSNDCNAGFSVLNNKNIKSTLYSSYILILIASFLFYYMINWNL